MKKLFLLLVMFAVIAACNKTEIDDLQSQSDLKDYVLTVDLMAGQNIYVGTVTYLDTEDGYFKITYDLVDDWTMSESHAYAGLLDDMPRVKKGAPKIGLFPYSATHDPEVSTYTYTHQIAGWPDPSCWDDFVCAAHAVVNHPTYPSETAWASGNMAFSSKSGWATYTDNFSTSAVYANVIFGIQQNTDGSLGLVYINTSLPVPQVIISEVVSTSGGEVVGAAFDPEENLLYFVIGNTLYVNNMNVSGPSIAIGTLPGLPVGGAFINGNFYYLDLDPNSSNFNEIIEVQLTYNEVSGSWTMVINDNFSNPMIFTNYQITDMASNGTEIYLVGIDNNTGNVDLIIYDISSGSFNNNVTNTQLNGISQITFGPDGGLYAIDTDNTGNSELVSLDLGTGDKDVIDLPTGGSLDDMSDLVIGKF